MGYRVYVGNPGTTTEAGFGKVAKIPCIFDSRPGYHRLGSRYLIDRGLGVWNPETRDEPSQTIPPTSRTIRNYADWLANFLEWAELRHIDLSVCDYQADVHGKYQKEMREGIWSRDARGLSARTVNQRVQQACDFLSWMSDKGHRGQFEVPYETRKIRVGSATGAHGHRVKQVKVRKGKVRQDKRHLRMPTDSELKTWLDKVYRESGYTKGLMCETILLTAMRREEVASWRIDTLPENPSEWHIKPIDGPAATQRVLVTIKFGTKGPEYGYDHNDKIGPERTIWMPLHLAERLHEYRMKLRNPALKRWIKAAPTPTEQRNRIKTSVHLFLDEKTGERLTSKDLYNAWTGVELPYKGWSPHLGRDWWACSVLWREMQKHEQLRELGVDAAAALLESSALSIIRLVIQPQLGHSDDHTTMIYVQWVADMLGVSLAIGYEAELDAEEH